LVLIYGRGECVSLAHTRSVFCFRNKKRATPKGDKKCFINNFFPSLLVLPSWILSLMCVLMGFWDESGAELRTIRMDGWNWEEKFGGGGSRMV
jgi:hypothetical protein